MTRKLIYFILAILMVVVNSCTDDVAMLSTNQKENGKYVYDMVFQGTISSYDSDSRGVSYQWEDGATLYLVLDNNHQATATYSAASDSWRVGFNEELLVVSSLKCTVIYNPGGTIDHASDGTLYHKDLYMDGNIFSGICDYGFDGQTLVVKGILEGQARLKIVADKQANIQFRGIRRGYRIYQYWDYFDYDTYIAYKPISINVNIQREDGKYESEYIYGTRSDLVDTIYIYDQSTPDYVFSQKIPEVYSDSFFEEGSSWIINLPTLDNHAGWTIEDNYVASIPDVEVEMVNNNNNGSGYYWYEDTKTITLDKSYYGPYLKCECTSEATFIIIDMSNGNKSYYAYFEHFSTPGSVNISVNLGFYTCSTTPEEYEFQPTQIQFYCRTELKDELDTSDYGKKVTFSNIKIYQFEPIE